MSDFYTLLAIMVGGTCLGYLLNFLARVKSLDPSIRPPEDGLGGTIEAHVEKVREMGFDRWGRIAVNQGESLPCALWVMVACVACVVVGDLGSIAVWYFGVYFIARFLYSLCYLRGVGGVRTLLWFTGQLVPVVCATVSLVELATTGHPSVIIAIGCTLVLYLMQFAALVAGRDKNNHPPEDTVIGVNEEARAADRDARSAGPTRWERIAANQGENFPVALAVLWGAYLLNPGSPIRMAWILSFTGLRIVWLICYLLGLSPWRTIFFFLSVFVCLGAIVYTLWSPKELIGSPDDGDKTDTYFMMGTTGVLYILTVLANLLSVDPNNHPPEDAAIGMDDAKKEEYKAKLEAQGGFSRWNRIALNQQENVSFALVTFWAAYIVGMDAGLKSSYVVYFAAGYAGLRTIYVMFYLFALKPLRTLSWLLGHICVLSAVGFTIAKFVEMNASTSVLLFFGPALAALICLGLVPSKMEVAAASTPLTEVEI